jgi:hypothetical protein
MRKCSLNIRFCANAVRNLKTYAIIFLLVIIKNQISYGQANVVWQYIHSSENEEGRLVLVDIDNNIWSIWELGIIAKLDHFGDTIFTMVADPENTYMSNPIKAMFDNQENLVVVLNGSEPPNIKFYEIVKIDLNGNRLWKLKVINPDPNLVEMQISAIDIDDNDNIYLTGSNGTQHWSYFYTAKVSTDGILVWENSYNGPIYSEHEGNDIVVFDSNNIYATGYHHEASNIRDAVIIKYNHTGETVWTDTFNYWEYFGNSYGNLTFGFKVKNDHLNNVYMLASGIYTGFPVIIKYDPSGVRQWIIKPDSIMGVSYENMIIDGTAIYISTGRKDETFKVSVKKYDLDGNQIWHTEFDSIGLVGTCMMMQDNGIVITGFNDTNYNSKEKQCTFKLDLDGNILWSCVVDTDLGGYNDEPFDLAQDDAGAIFVTGLGINGFYEGLTYKIFECKNIDPEINVQSNYIEANYIPGAYYRWYHCFKDSLVAGDKEMTRYYPPDTAMYKVKIYVDSCSCVDSSGCTSVEHMGFDEDDIINSLKIYPVPTKSDITIDFGKLVNVSLYLYDIQGRIIFSEQIINSTTHKLSIPPVPGVYIVELRNGKGSKKYKLIKE